jgi:uncharacterized protein (DUF736 family)
MKVTLLVVLLAGSASAQTYVNYHGFCQTGNTPAVVGGVSSSNTLQGSYPSCQVEVYNHGTLTTTTLYSNSSGTSLSNPFTANSDGSYTFYYVPTEIDIALSGGGFPSTVTISDVYPPVPSGTDLLVMATPTSTSGSASLRQLTSSDISLAGTLSNNTLGSAASLASTTPCSSGTAPVAGQTVATPSNGIATNGTADCPTMIIEPEATSLTNTPAGSLWVNNLNGIRNSFSFNPLSYNGAAIAAATGGVGQNNSLGDCYNNTPFINLPNTFSGSPSNYILPCYIYFAPEYQLWGDGGNGFSPLNANFFPPAYRDPNLASNAKFSRGSFLYYNYDAINEVYWNPGICAYEIAAGVTNQRNCASSDDAYREFQFVFTNPLYTSGSNGNLYGIHEDFKSYDGTHNENVVGGVFFTNFDPFDVNTDSYMQAQGGAITAHSIHPAGGDNLIFRITGSYGGYSSGADQGGALLWGGFGESSYEYGFTVTSFSQLAATATNPSQLWLGAGSIHLGSGSAPGPAAGPNHFIVDSTSGGYTSGDVQTIAINPSITLASGGSFSGNTASVFRVSGTTSAAWQTLFGSSGNNFVNISATAPSEGQSVIPTNASGPGSSYGCVAYGTAPAYQTGNNINGNVTPTYPAPAVCFAFNTVASPPAAGSYVQITDGRCSETEQVIYSDTTHIVAAASCQHAADTLIYWGAAVGLALRMAYDSTLASVTGGDQIDAWRQIAGADNSGNLFVMDFLPKGGTPYVNGQAYQNTTNDIQPVPGSVTLTGSSVSVGTPTTAGKYVSDTNNSSGTPHLLAGVPVTFSGGTCSVQPTAVFTASYISNYYYSQSVTMTNPGTCTVAPSASGPTETANPYSIEPAVNVVNVLSNFFSGNINSSGLRTTPNPYSDSTTGFSSTPFTGTTLAFAATTSNHIQEAHLLQMEVSYNSQFGEQQFGKDNYTDYYANFVYTGSPKSSLMQFTYKENWENFYVLPKTTPLPNPFPEPFSSPSQPIPSGQPLNPSSAFTLSGPVGTAFAYMGQLMSGATGEGAAFVGTCANTNGGYANLMPCWEGYYAPFYHGGYFSSINGTQENYYGTEFDISNQVVNIYSNQSAPGSAVGRELRVWSHTATPPDTVEVVNNLKVDVSLALGGGATLTGQTGTGTSIVTNTGPTISSPTITGTIPSATITSLTVSSCTGCTSGSATSPSGCVIGTGAGTGGSCAATGLDGSHQLSVTIGTSPATNAVLATVTFGDTVDHRLCVFQAANSYAAQIARTTSGLYIPGSGAVTYSLTGTSALTAGNTYIWNVECGVN